MTTRFTRITHILFCCTALFYTAKPVLQEGNCAYHCGGDPFFLCDSLHQFLGKWANGNTAMLFD